ncbi:MAG: hypothetical protein IIA58_00605 [Candidatus Marinimicrobia bacterium]|nr:hypothetical protein [Candidatus Neomarinimicrobiota bacterium]
MSINFERPEDAYLAVAWAVLVADNVGSIQERNFMHSNVKGLALFNDYSEEEYSNMVGAMYMKANQLFLDKEGALIEEKVLELIAAVKECLNDEDCLEVYSMAVGIACADELCEEEIRLLTQLQAGLNIDENVASNIFEEYKNMN